MKKLLTLIYLIIFSALIFSTDIYAAENASHKLYLDITFKENLFFDKYDVDLYVDDQKIDTLEYASPFTKLVDVTGSKHTVTFYKSSNYDYYGSEEIEINSDATYRATIQTEGKKVKIVSSDISENLDGSSIEVEDVSLMFLPDAMELLKSLGLNAITYKSADGGKIQKEANWIVLSQSIDPGNAIDKNDELILTCQKITDFVTEKFVGLSVPDAINTANELPYEISFVDPLIGRNMYNVFCEASEDELIQWSVESAVPVDSNQKVAVLNVVFQGQTVVPHVEGMSLKNAITEMHTARLSNVHGLSSEGREIKDADADKWKVITQSEDGGETVNADKEITLSCEAYAELSEITAYKIIYQAPEDAAAEGPTKTEERTHKETEPEIADKSEVEAESATEAKTEPVTEAKTSVAAESKRETVSGRRGTDVAPLVSAAGSAAAVVSAENRNTDATASGTDSVADKQEETTAETNAETAAERPTETERPRKKTTYTTTSNINVRSSPSTDGQLLGQYSAYAQISVYAIENGWAWIDYGGTDAYVSANYIQKGVIMNIQTPETDAPAVNETRSVPQTESSYQEPMVWISGSGTKYHSRSSCSNMRDPWQVTISEAQSIGRTPCKKCN